MLTLMPDLPGNVVGLVASGQVSAPDYENILIPALNAALGQQVRVRILYQLADDFDGFSAGAMWDDLRVGLAHFNAWEKIAIVSDLSWVNLAARMFSVVMPCPIRVFNLGQLAQARAWVVQ